MHTFKKLALASSLSALALLSACGGGDDEGIIVDEKDPEPTGLTATATISVSGDAALLGAYATTNVRLNNVTRVNPIGADPETCRFKFEGLEQTIGGRVLGGDVRYLPDSVQLRTTFINVDGVEFVQEGTTGAAVDRLNNRVVYTNAVLNSTQGTGRSITFSGTIPMLGNRPGSC